MDKLIDMITRFLEADPITIVVWFFVIVIIIATIALMLKGILAAI
jgi:hypothetical protein